MFFSVILSAFTWWKKLEGELQYLPSFCLPSEHCNCFWAGALSSEKWMWKLQRVRRFRISFYIMIAWSWLFHSNHFPCSVFVFLWPQNPKALNFNIYCDAWSKNHVYFMWSFYFCEVFVDLTPVYFLYVWLRLGIMKPMQDYACSFSACSDGVQACSESIDKNGECEQCERFASKDNYLSFIFPIIE